MNELTYKKYESLYKVAGSNNRSDINIVVGILINLDYTIKDNLLYSYCLARYLTCRDLYDVSFPRDFDQLNILAEISPTIRKKFKDYFIPLGQISQVIIFPENILRLRTAKKEYDLTKNLING